MTSIASLATVDRLDVSPLGAGALAGTSLPIDPAPTAADLGFARAFDNSLDAVSDRDFVAEALFDLALVGVHLARLGEEWSLWTSEEFGFARLDDAYATGSSMLPQKKNPDVAELARGKSGRLIGNLTGLLATLKGLPLAYNRDLQEDKEPLFDSVDQVSLALLALAGMIETARVPARPDGRRRGRPGAAATDLAEWLVGRRHPVPPGPRHRRRARPAEPRHRRLAVRTGRADQRLGADAAALVGPGVAVRRRTSPGGGGPQPVAAQIERFGRDLARRTRETGLMGYRQQVRVRYSECDMQGVVFNAHYLAYCDDAVDTWLRQVLPGQVYGAGGDGATFDFMTKTAAVTFHRGLTFGELADLECAVTRFGRHRFDITIEGSVGDRAVVHHPTHVRQRRAGHHQPCPVPDARACCSVRVTRTPARAGVLRP